MERVSGGGVTRLAMSASAVMLAYQVASKAVRDAVFLSAWPATALPAVVIASAVLAFVLVPLFARLLARFGPRIVVPSGFLVSAAGHLIEWKLSSHAPWVAVAIYLHIAGLGALLLSGFWSLVSELFDPQAAKRNYSRIAAAGTAGGIVGGIAAERAAALFVPDAALLLLVALHIVSAAATTSLVFRSRESVVAAAVTPAPMFARGGLRASPHVRALAAIVLLGTAGAAIVDYLFKSSAASRLSRQGNLLEFFALFYTITQVATFAAQTAVPKIVAKLGLGRTISSLPAGVGGASVLALLFPAFPTFLFARAVELILRGSLFRSGYELVFNPMDPAEKRRTKTFLDVACDRAGDAVGAGIVQIFLIVAPAFLVSELLASVIAIAGVAIWVGGRLDAMYVGVVGERLIHQAGGPPTIVGSEPIWTVLDAGLVVPQTASIAAPPPRAREPAPPPITIEPWMRTLTDLRSGNRQRVETALRGLRDPDSVEFAQVVQLLAWDDVLPAARRVLEAGARKHVGLLVDMLVDASTEFAIRRRIPRVLAGIPTQRALDGLICGLDDERFEVRYQCSRGIDRLLTRHEGLAVDRARILAVVERELSVERTVWNAYRVLDKPETDEEVHTEQHQNLEHAFLLLAAVLPREPLLVALHGIDSEDPVLRGLAIEFLESVLPPHIAQKLWAVLDARVEDAERVSPEAALERLRRSQEPKV
jgi:ATP:ADP antiporter, AAA family